MDDLNDILESEELKAVVAGIEALHRKYSAQQQSASALSVQALTSGQEFRAREVLQALTSESVGYPGQKEVLAAGFSGWLLFPKDRDAIETLMRYAMMFHLDEAEEAVGYPKEQWSLHRDLVARYLLVGIPFIAEVVSKYDGYKAFTESMGLDVLDEVLQRESKIIYTVVRAIAYLHHGADLYRADPSRRFKPSVNRAVLVFRELDAMRSGNGAAQESYDYVGRSLLHQRWSGGKSTLALLYSANRISVEGSNLLEVMLGGAFSYKKHGHLIPRWLQMAQYVCEHIFGVMEDPELVEATQSLIGEQTALRFAAVKLSEYEAVVVRKKFNKYFQSDR